ncbi:MAG: TolC family protein [Bacteroidales bacterium]|nr:TolC family protein [Bacteroidales bacterium]
MRYTLLSLLLCLAAISSTAQDHLNSITPLTYEEAIALVINNNETLRQSAIKVEQMEEEKKGKVGLFFPKISLSANYVLMTDPMELDLTPVQEAITPLYEKLGTYGDFSGLTSPYPDKSNEQFTTEYVREKLLAGGEAIEAANWTTTIQDQSFGMVAANFVLPIYAGGKIRVANKAAKINIDEATAQSRQKLGEVTMELVERYYGLLLAQKVEIVRHKVMETMHTHMDNAEKMKNEGLISNTLFLQSKVYYTEAKREKDKAENKVSIVNNALINTLATGEGSQISVMSSFFYHQELKSIDYFKTQAGAHSPMLEQIGYKQDLLEQKHHVERGNYLPTVAAMGTYTLADKDLSEFIPRGMMGVGLSWTVFEGGSRNQAVKASQLQSDQVELFYTKSKANIETMITKYYHETEMHLDQIHQLNVSKEFATDYYKSCEKSFKQGLSTSTEVSDASLLLAKIQIEQLKATYDYDVSLSKLLYFAGIPEQFGDYLNTGIAIK